MTQWALVTGASGGIGLEIARQCLADGMRVVLVARSEERLRAAAAELDASGTRVQWVAKDLADPDAPAELHAQLKGNGIDVHLLVNNAGFGVYGSYLETDGDREVEMIRLNIEALTRLTKLYLPEMVARKAGGILNVASTAAFQPGPLMAVYYATKAYVLSYSEALSNELKGTGVSVTALCPGPTTSGFQKAAAMETSRLVKSPNMMTAASVARKGFRAWKAGRAVVIPGAVNRMVATSVRFIPRGLVTSFARKIMEQVAK